MRSNSIQRSHPSLRALIGLLYISGCFSEPETVIDDTGTTTTSVDPTSSGPTTTTQSVEPPADSTGGSDSTSDSSSTGGPQTSSSGEMDSTGVAAVCGDGEINQPNEMCDSTVGCADDCTFEDYDCNPLNDAACVDGLRCGAADVAVESFNCMLPGRGGVGDACSGVPANDSDCGVGLTCLFNFNTPLCNMGNCCVEYCDITGDFMCSGGAVCRPFFIDPVGQGLEHLGFCGSP